MRDQPRAVGLALAFHEIEDLEGHIAVAREAFGDDAGFDAGVEEGRKMSLEEAATLATRQATDE